VVLVTAHGTMHTAVQAMRQGADDILEKPVALDELELLLLRLAGRRRLVGENRLLRAEVIGGELVVASPAMREVVALVQRVAPSRAAILVQGETGTGKERIAAMLHRCSDRSRAVLEAELRRGAGEPAGERAVRPRGRGLHRGRQTARRAL
jgi:two-component system, NtrC family, response regulator AtoC